MVFNPLKIQPNQFYTSVIGKNVLLTATVTPYCGDPISDIGDIFDPLLTDFLMLMGHSDISNYEI